MRLRKTTLILFGIFLVVSAVSLKIFLDSIYRIPVLMYHSIDYTADKSDKMTIQPDMFERQMKFLRDYKYNVVPLEKAVAYIKLDKMPPSNTVAITIDDGYENNYTHAYPILKKYHIPVTIFIITDHVDRPGFMTWSQIKEMSDSGIVDVESHTRSHPFLQYDISDEALKNELAGSKDVLEKKLDKRIRYVCYPMGGYNERVKEAVKKAGYEAAFATKPKTLFRKPDLYAIKRVRISPSTNNLFVFYLKLTGYHAFVRVVQSDYKEIPYTLWKKGS